MNATPPAAHPNARDGAPDDDPPGDAECQRSDDGFDRRMHGRSNTEAANCLDQQEGDDVHRDADCNEWEQADTDDELPHKRSEKASGAQPGVQYCVGRPIAPGRFGTPAPTHRSSPGARRGGRPGCSPAGSASRTAPRWRVIQLAPQGDRCSRRQPTCFAPVLEVGGSAPQCDVDIIGEGVDGGSVRCGDSVPAGVCSAISSSRSSGTPTLMKTRLRSAALSS